MRCALDLLDAYYNDAQDERPQASNRQPEERAIELFTETSMRGAFSFGQPARDALYSHVEPRPFSGRRIFCRNYAKPRRRMMPNTPNQRQCLRPVKSDWIDPHALIRAPSVNDSAPA